MKKASVVIQARMGSSRLPGKVMMPLAGKPVLEHVVRRCQKARLVERVIVATTIDPKDLVVVNFLNGLGSNVFCGSVDDVLDRYYQVARLFDLRHIVRITADCPMIDPDVIDHVISGYFASRVDYASNTLQLTYPNGLDVEVFSFDVLQEAWQKAVLLSEREHVTPYIIKSSIFKKMNISHDVDLSCHRWTLDEPRDYEKLSMAFNFLYYKDVFFHLEDALQFFNANPQIDKLNMGISRNEGYQKSLVADKKVFRRA